MHAFQDLKAQGPGYLHLHLCLFWSLKTPRSLYHGARETVVEMAECAQVQVPIVKQSALPLRWMLGLGPAVTTMPLVILVPPSTLLPSRRR